MTDQKQTPDDALAEIILGEIYEQAARECVAAKKAKGK